MKLLLGDSSCIHWRIAQARNRETRPEEQQRAALEEYRRRVRPKNGPRRKLDASARGSVPAVNSVLMRQKPFITVREEHKGSGRYLALIAAGLSIFGVPLNTFVLNWKSEDEENE